MDDTTRDELDTIRLTDQTQVHRQWQRDRAPWQVVEEEAHSLEEVVDHVRLGDHVVVRHLIGRPGGHGLDADTRLFARRLFEGARRAGIQIEPIHVADDHEIRAFAPDDVAA